MNKHWKSFTLLALLSLEGVLLFTFASAPPETTVIGNSHTVKASSAATSAIAGNIGSHHEQADDYVLYDKKELHRIYKTDKRTLVLVNGENKLKEKNPPPLMSISHGRLQASKYLYNALVQMLADARKEGYQYFIASAYRSRDKQQRLVDEGVRKRMKMGLSHKEAYLDARREIMAAGHSEHETGLALDILCAGNTKLDSSQHDEPGNTWLQANCHKYGFILRYPKGKENITGITYEPWHFRYVGERAATYMRDENITLEEFWQRLGDD